MKKKLPIILLGVILACVLVFGFLYANNDIGKTANSLEADIRQSQKILDDWIVDGSISDTMAAFISYPQDKTDHTFSVYVNRPGLSFGYFFRGGGDIVEVDDYIAEFVVEGNNERAFISMNLPKKIHQNGISYTLVGDYYIPDLKLPEESRPIGRWGRMHKAFLQEHRPGQYNALLLSGKLWTYLADLNEQAADRLACIVSQMQEAEGVTEELKARDQLAWVGGMNSIRSRAEEIILSEMIFV